MPPYLSWLEAFSCAARPPQARVRIQLQTAENLLIIMEIVAPGTTKCDLRGMG